MKNFCKIMSLALAILMLASVFAACDQITPDVTVTTPDVTTPEETTPEVTTPEVTTPEVTTPEVTTPEVSTPEGTTPKEEPVVPQIVLGLDVLLAGKRVGFDLSVGKDLDVNPWSYAMQAYKAWKNNQKNIDAVGATDTVVPTNDKTNEYTVDLKIAPASQTKIDSVYNDKTVYFGEAGSKSNLTYGGLKMRTLDTILDYEYSSDAASDIDIYGGYMGWGKFEEDPTGYFHTAYIDGRWWIIDPLGYPFFRTAVNTINITSGGTYQLFGSNKQNWAQKTSDRLHELGFNSMGGWSDLATLSKVENPLNGTAIIAVLKSFGHSVGMMATNEGASAVPNGVLPFFNPDFEDYAEGYISRSISAYANNPYIFGWMSDNEMPAKGEALGNYLTCLSMTKAPTNRYDYTYEYAMAWTFIYMETGKTHLTNKDIKALCSTDKTLASSYKNGSDSFTKAELDALRTEFLQMIFDRYFSIIKPIFNKVAPNHMYIGTRALEAFYGNQKMMQVLGYYCDVITINYYHRTIPFTDEIVNIAKWGGKPFMFTEWYAKGMDACNFSTGLSNKSGAGWTVQTQDDRGIFYESFVLKLLECKYCVGFDWFSYIDNNPNNTSADASNTSSNKGIVSYVGAYSLTNEWGEYTDLTDHMSDVNNAKYSLIEFFDARR